MMMEKLGQAKTHLELKKMIAEVDRENRGMFCCSNIVLYCANTEHFLTESICTVQCSGTDIGFWILK